MISLLLWFIFLSYLDTERALLGSRRRFGDNGLKPFDVNMGFSDEDRIF